MNGPSVFSVAQSALKAPVTLAQYLAPARLRWAIAHSGIGFDHENGEQVVALGHDKYEAANAFREGHAVATDRRIFGRQQGMSGTGMGNRYAPFDIPYPWIAQAQFKSGMLLVSLDITLTNGQRAKMTTQTAEFGLFIETLTRQVPPQARMAPLPGLTPAPDDPAGVSAAQALLQSGDPRPPTLLRAIWEAGRRGEMVPQAAQAMSWRTVLLDRTIRAGRGQSQGAWMSFLPRRVLIRLMHAVLGDPVGGHQEPQQDILDFALKRSGSSALAKNVVGLAALALTGVGFFSTGGGPSIQGIRVIVADAPLGSAFWILGIEGGRFQPLTVTHPRLTEAILEATIRVDARFLLAHALFQTSRAPEELLAVTPEEMGTELGNRIGHPDASSFFA
jgi:hypothetical protein